MRNIIIALLFIACLIVCPSFAEAGPDYEFSTDWVSGKGRTQLWKRVLQRYVDKPNVHALEIGSFEGRSAIWFLDNILTQPSSTITCIDIFPGKLEEKFDSNIEKTGRSGRVIKIKGMSQKVLRNLKLGHYDFIYIDACHTAHCTLMETVLSWQLLKNRGVIIFDDYAYKLERPLEMRPKMAIDAFLQAFHRYVDVLYIGYQIVIQKREERKEPTD